MKIILTGAGSAGHVYPLFAVAQNIRKISEENKLLQPEIYFISDKPYDESLLFKNNITFKQIKTGKMRRYFSVVNFLDFFKTIFAIIKAFFLVFSIYPDVVFTNGGHGAFPVLIVARFFRIPVMLHVSDSVPGRVLTWSSKFAKHISIGFPEAVDYFPEDKIAFTGNPIRRGSDKPLTQGAHEFLKLDSEIPTILIMGGSQGAQMINDIIVDILPNLIEKYQVIHQTGPNNFNDVTQRVNLILENNKNKDRYKPFKYLDFLAQRMAVGASNLIISRAGTTISEIAVWGIPSIIIPITDSQGNHQRKNAFSYAGFGATVVIEETNLSAHILEAEIEKIMTDGEKREKMITGAKEFAKPDAAKKIADKILTIGVGHEK